MFKVAERPTWRGAKPVIFLKHMSGLWENQERRRPWGRQILKMIYINAICTTTPWGHTVV
ncbi:MAG: hypothetical protein CM1200mP4_3040 [Rhodospirillaceae bacterium]|nr:MAG: hypothetical protein CM1200mP4_3040 [Rhodospirillaceae bacterium]